MRVLITGATGFIGERTSRLFVQAGHRVRAFALPGTEGSLHGSGVAEFVGGDVTDERALARVTRGVDAVVHLAGLLPGHAPTQVTRVNERGTETALSASAKNGVRRFVLASSTSVYRDASNLQVRALTETSPLRDAASTSLELYGLTKAHAEQRVRAYRTQHGISHAILRFPIVYGSADGWDRDVVERIRAQPWTALASPFGRVPNMQWIHVDDAARALVLAAGVAVEGAFNVAGSELFSMAEVALLVGQLDAAPALRGTGPIPARPLKYEIASARQNLGFVPVVRLIEGLRRQLATTTSGARA